MRALAGACLLAAGVLAGCLGGAGPSDGPASGPGLALQPGVDDPERYVVNVTEATPDGPPIAGATVAFFNATREPGGGPFDARPGELPCATPTDLGASPDWRVLAAGVADEDGRIVGRLDPDATVVSVAVAAPGYTTEVALDGGADEGDCDLLQENIADLWADGHHPVPLFRRRLPVDLQGRLNASASTRFLGTGWLPTSEPVWDPRPFGLHDDPYAILDYRQRLAGLDLDLRWNNTAMRYGDLYLAAGTDTAGDPVVFGGDSRQLPGNGASVETLETSWERSSAPPLEVVGPATNRTVVSADGMPWQIGGEATFRGVPLLLPGDR